MHPATAPGGPGPWARPKGLALGPKGPAPWALCFLVPGPLISGPWAHYFWGPGPEGAILEFQHFLAFLEVALTVLASPGSPQTEIRRSGTNSRRSTTFRRRVWQSQPYMSRSPSRNFVDFDRIWSRPPLAQTQMSTPEVVFRRLLRDFGLSSNQLG